MANTKTIDFRHELESCDYRLVEDGAAVIVISANDKQDRMVPNYSGSETVARRYDSPQVAYMRLVRNRGQQ